MKLMMIAISMLLAFTAYADETTTYQTYGNITYGSNGSTYQTYGNTTYGSDGSTAQHYGNQTYVINPSGQLSNQQEKNPTPAQMLYGKER